MNKPVLLTAAVKADAKGNLPEKIELARTGDWNTPWHGDFELTTADFHEAVANFNAGVYRVQGTEPLAGTLDHLGGESPAALRITNIYVDGESLMADVTWTDLGKEKLARDEYRYISFEYNPRTYPLEDPEEAGKFIPNVLTGATLTNDPLFKKLKPVMASVKAGVSDKSKGERHMDLATLRAKKPEELKDDEKQFVTEHAAELTSEERKTFELQTDADKEAETKAADEAKVKADEEAAATAKADADAKVAEESEAAEEAKRVEASAKKFGMTKEELTQLRADAKAGREASQKLAETEARTFIHASVAKGQIKTGDSDKWTKTLLASTGTQRTELEGLIKGLPINASIGKELGDGGVENATGAADEAHAKTIASIKASAEKGKVVGYYAAHKEVLAADPALAAKVKEESENQ